MYRNNRFCELLKEFPRRVFEKVVAERGFDKYSKRFHAWHHMVAMVYGQISGARSLRELEVGFNSQSAQHYHLGCNEIKRSTLADANAKRDSVVFKEVCEYLMQQTHRRVRKEVKKFLYLLDSTSITLKGFGYDQWTLENSNYLTQGLKVHLMVESSSESPVFVDVSAPNVNDITVGKQVALEKGSIYVFDKGYYDYSWWYSIHQAGAKFVTRFKTNAGLNVLSHRAIPKKAKGIVLDDMIVEFKCKRSGSTGPNDYYGTRLRRITIHRPDHKRSLVLATNDMKSSAQTIAALYKQRWEIELFFKWIKQNLKIKRYLGRSENAVKIQIYAALITYLLASHYHRESGYLGTLKLFCVMLRECLFQRPALETIVAQKRRQREEENLSSQMVLAL